MCREKWKCSLIGATSRRLSVSVKALLDQLRLLPLQPTVSPPPPPPRPRSLCYWPECCFAKPERLCLAAGEAQSERKVLWPRIRASALSPPGEEQNKEALQDVEDEAQWDYATTNSRTLPAPPHTLPPSLSSPSSVALSPSRVAELTSLFFSPFLFLY